MTRIFNKQSEKEKRRYFRKNMPKAEVLLWIQLKSKRMLGQRFLRQYSVGSYVVDFYCPKLKLAIEVDGPTHFTDENREYDPHRQAEIETLGIEFLRFINPEVYSNMDGVLRMIRETIVRRINSTPLSSISPVTKGGIKEGSL